MMQGCRRRVAVVKSRQGETYHMDKIAVVGGGLIGRAWSIVFARAGFAVSLFDSSQEAASKALGFIEARLPELHDAGLLAYTPGAVMARISLAPTLEAALDGTVYVQENGPERLAQKTALFARMDEIAAPSTILASSTSGIPASAFTERLPGRARCVVAHPVNPPYLVPVVEICPSPWTSTDTVARTRELMTRAKMVPATIKREVAGFVLNRLQIALVAEAFRLVADGVVSPQDCDATIKHGLGLRWAFMGPFETIDLNAPGGVSDYCERYGRLYSEVQAEQTPIDLTEERVAAVDRAMRDMLPLDQQEQRQEWRDRRLMALLAHKATQPD
jgi:3-hydroxyacyl-CoA dehydrogenase